MKTENHSHKRRSTLNLVANRLYFGMATRLNRNRPPHLAALPLPFTLDEFKEFLMNAGQTQQALLNHGWGPEVSWTCVLCEKPVGISHLSVDHANPVGRGGSYRLENLRVCHARCNRSKGPLSLDEFKDLDAYLQGASAFVRNDVLGRLALGTTHRMAKAREAKH